MDKKIILLTGATGFVGKKLLNEFKYLSGYRTILLTRSLVPSVSPDDQILFTETDWDKSVLSLNNVTHIVHCAGLAHSSASQSITDGKRYIEANVRLTRRLVKLANAINVSFFVYLSSVNVYGEVADKVISVDSPLKPITWYAKSKLKSEEIIKRNLRNSEINYLIIRPSVIYDVSGTKNSGNIKRVQRIANALGFFILPNTNNKRSYLNLETLAVFISNNIKTGMKTNQIVIAADVEPMSFRELLKKIARPNLIILDINPIWFGFLKLLSKDVDNFLLKTTIESRIDANWKLVTEERK